MYSFDNRQIFLNIKWHIHNLNLHNLFRIWKYSRRAFRPTQIMFCISIASTTTTTTIYQYLKWAIRHFLFHSLLWIRRFDYASDFLICRENKTPRVICNAYNDRYLLFDMCILFVTDYHVSNVSWTFQFEKQINY